MATNQHPQKLSRIREEVIAEIRGKAKIDEIIGEYVTLKRSGSGMIGLCPFHDERSGSFHVSAAKGMYKCFGCGEGGDVIAFIQKIDSSTFSEAIEKLGGKVGVAIEYTDGYRPVGLPAGVRTRLLEVNNLAARFFVNQLKTTPDGAVGLEYLKTRGFDAEAIAGFDIGFSPTGWDGLTNALKGRGYTDEEIVTAGLARAREGKEGIYDLFRGRLMWPIRDLAGDVIGFGGRKISEEDTGPKYLNTPETPLYHKSDVLYGIHAARKAIATSKEAVIVEGYTDVMACHLSGVMNAVAACGTAFGDGHIKVLRRIMHDVDMFGGKVIFTFDGDGAGQKAALRAFKENNRFTATTYVVIAPNGQDPAEIRQNLGAQGLRDLMATAVPLAEFVIKTTIAEHNLSTIEGRTNALRASAPVVAGIKDTAMRQQYIVILAGWLGVDERHVRTEVQTALRSIERESASAAKEDTIVAEPKDNVDNSISEDDDPFGEPVVSDDTNYAHPDPQDTLYAAEREALKCLLQFPEMTIEWDTILPHESFTHPTYLALYRDITKTSHENKAINDLVTELTVESLPVPDDIELYPAYIAGCLNRLLIKGYDRSISHVKAKLARGEGDATVLFDELLSLETLKRNLKDHQTE